MLGLDQIKSINTNKKEQKIRTVRFANVSLDEEDENEKVQLYNESSSGQKMEEESNKNLMFDRAILQINNQDFQEGSNLSRGDKNTDDTQQKKREKEIEQWSALRCKVQYSSDGVAEYSSLKAVLRNRVQFNLKNKQTMERIERRYRIDHSELMAYPDKVVQIVWKEKGKDNTNKSHPGEKKEEEKKSLIDKFNEAYNYAILRVSDEQSFFIHGKMVKFGKNALGIFENKNKFRWAFAWLATSKYLERFIIFIIIINSILMGIKDYKDKEDSSPVNSFIALTEPYFTGIFTAESFIRIVAMGFFMGNNTYLSDGWNWLDFIVVITSLLNQIPGMVGVSGLRTFRLFRPLRSLTSMPSMKLLVETLLSSIFQLGGVLGLVGFFFTIFAILGISLWSGSIHYRCYTQEWPNSDGTWPLVKDYRWLCTVHEQCGPNNFCGNRYDAYNLGYNINYTTINQDSDVLGLDYGITNFDNFYMACLTILQCITLEGWSSTMEFYTYSKYDFMVVIYFVAVTIVCALFLLNLTIAVMLMKYQDNDKSSAGQNHILELKSLGAQINLPIPLTNFIINNDRLTVDQKALVILKVEETFFQSLFKNKQIEIDQENSYYQFFLVKISLAVIQNQYFEATMIVIIVMNTVCLAIDQDPPLEDDAQEVLQYFNIFFMVVFSLETVFKSIGLGLKSFFKELFNVFDLTIVLVSLLEITVLQNSRMLSSLRAFRLFKIFKLFNSGDLRILIDSISFTLRSIADYAVLLSLFIYVFALLGATFFAGNVKLNSSDQVDLENGDSPQNNYDNLFQSVLTVFCVMIGDNWNNIMYVIMRCCGHYSAFYFITLIIMGHIIMLNLFLAILLGNFDKARNFAQKQKVFDAFHELLSSHTLNDSIDLIFGEMSFYIKTRVLKWEKIQLEKIQAEQLILLHKTQKLEIVDQNHDIDYPIEQVTVNIEIKIEILPKELDKQSVGQEQSKVIQKKTSYRREDIANQKKRTSKKTSNSLNSSKFDTKIKEQKQAMLMEKQINNEINKNEIQTLKKLRQNKGDQKIENPNIKRMFELNRMVHVAPFEGLKEILRKEENLNESNLLSLKDEDVWQLKYLQKKFIQKKERNGSVKNIKTTNQKLTEENAERFQTFKQQIMRQIFDKENDKKEKEEVQNLKHQQITEISRKIMKDYTNNKENKNYIKVVLEDQKRQSSCQEEDSDSEEYGEIQQKQEDIKSPIDRIKEYTMDSSLFMFHKDSYIRQLCLKLAETPENNQEYLKFCNQAPVEVIPQKKASERAKNKVKSTGKEYFTQHPSKIFEDIILVCIIASSIMLALDNPLDDPDSVLIVTLSYIGIFFTVIFIFECIVKVIAKGFLFNSLGPIQPYIHDSWNMLDFIIVCSSTLDLIYFIAGIDTSKLKFLKALRALRALRPMKVIQKNDGMRLIVKSLLASIPSMSNVLIVVGLIMLIFSIMGVSLFKGTFYQCYQDPMGPLLNFANIKNKDDCLNQKGKWRNLISNFDNTPRAMDALFGMMTTEGWISLMFQGMNAMGKDIQPVKDANVYSVFYFIGFMIVGSQFLMNLFVGVVIDNFQCIKEKEELDNIFVTYDQRSWIEIQKIGQTKSLRKKNQKPIGVQFLFYQLVHHQIFDNTITLCIIMNTVLMSIQYYQMSASLDNIAGNINLGLSIVFNIELICKLVGFGKIYFYSNWNIFDMVIVIITDAGILVDFLNLGEELRMISTIIRSFRIMRMLKLIRSNIHMRLVLDTCFNILPQMSNVMSLFMLMFFIFGTLGMNLFSSVMHQTCIDDFFNFETFPHSIMILIRFSTGESWNQCMYEFANTVDFPDVQCQDQTYKQRLENGGKVLGCGTVLSYIYFYLFVIIVQILLMNLSVAAVIEGLETSKKENMGVVQGDQIEELIDYWEDYDLQATGWITAKDLVFLLYELPQPLGKRPAKIDFLSKDRDEVVAKSSSQGLRNEDRYLVHTEKNVVLKKTHALELLNKLDIQFYDDPVKQVNFVDVFKALVNRVFEEKKIDFEVTEQLQQKIEKGWLRNFNMDSKDIPFYTIQEQQAGEFIVLWSRKILSKQKNNFKIKKKANKAEEEKKMTDDNQKQSEENEKKEIDQTEILKKSALLIQKMINNEEIDDKYSEKSNGQGYFKVINQYTWLEKKDEHQEIIDFDEKQPTQDDGYFELFNYKQ